MTVRSESFNYYLVSFSLAMLVMTLQLEAKQRLSPITEDIRQVTQWNHFADSLYVLHQSLIKDKSIRTEEEVGGYGGVTAGDFYNEIRYYDNKRNLLISKVQWELERPDVIHNIEIFIHDDEGHLLRDYYAGYLPYHRNAPLHTMINFYGDTDELMSFRQFDASGERIYEQCSGKHFSDDVDISLENDEWLAPSGESLKLIASEAYIACFGDTPKEVGKYLNPLVEIPKASAVSFTSETDDYTAVNRRIADLTQQISSTVNRAPLFTKRAEEYFNLGDMDKAEVDLTKAIELDPSHSQAWFWRGMVRGRVGNISAGIADLSVFIERHPNSSLAHTKRGVRYIWNGQLVKAEQDLKRAVELNPANAEAHDDLGVLLAQQQKLDKAVSHFKTTIRLDPSYQKGHHNLATALHLQGQAQAALHSVDNSLRLAPNDRSSLMLKSEILSGLGRNTEAVAIREQAWYAGEWAIYRLALLIYQYSLNDTQIVH